MKIIDISPVISERTAVYPGDTPFTRKMLMQTHSGEHLTLSAISTTLHIGAHADAVNHYAGKTQLNDRSQEGIEQKNLETYLGLCQVVEVNLPRGKRIYREDFNDEIKAPRVLFKTNSFPDRESWNTDYNSLSPELILLLASQGVTLVGIDTPSVDPDDSKRLESHQALLQTDVSVLEGLELSAVTAGLYSLIALPLKIADADASPVRAVLIDKSFFE